MGNYAYFQMDAGRRRNLIKAQTFYFEQGKKRLLSQFKDIGHEAELETQAWLEEQSGYFDPDDDPARIHEDARDQNILIFSLLEEMRGGVLVLLAAGIYHAWEKQLKEWLASEARHSGSGDHLRAAIWKKDFANMMDLFEGMGWAVRGAPFFAKLDACRLVANVHKHGSGPSFNDLKARCPEYLFDAFARGPFSDSRFADHTRLRVSEDQLEEFHRSIIGFWETVPGEIVGMPQRPAWFVAAMAKDGAGRAKPLICGDAAG
jgi:hypothetical protein